ncbi:MAG: TonB-dependent receptor, partial [Novosphingobium sp.]
MEKDFHGYVDNTGAWAIRSLINKKIWEIEMNGLRGTQRSVRLMAVLMAGTAFTSVPALAKADQETGEAAVGEAATTTGSEAVGIGDIIVTATRRAEKLQDVPLSISAIGSAQLASRGVVQTTDLAAVVPNLKVNSQYGDTQPNFSLRGVGVANEYNSNTASPIGVYIDEVYQSFRFTHGLQLYDLERVEVLRGPQGTLFGRNTTGGAVSVYTREPKLEGTNGYLSVGYGNYDRKKIEGAVEVTAVPDQVGLRIAVTRSKGDGFWKEVSPSTAFGGAKSYGTSDNFGIRGTLMMKPAPNFEISLKGFYSRDNPVGSPIFAKGLIGGVPGTNFFGYSREADGLAYDQYHLDGAGRFYTRVTGGSLRLNYEASDALTLTSVTGYSKARFDLLTDNDGSPQDIFQPHYRANTTDFSQDLRLSYARGPVKLLLGAYYGKDTSDSLNDVRAFNVFPDATTPGAFNPGGSVNPAAAPTSLNAQYGYLQRRQSYALYGEGTYSATDKLDLTLGLRYTHDKLDFDNAFSNAYSDLPGTLLFPLYAPFSQTNKSNNLSGRAIVNYKWSDTIRTYASFSRGYRSGAYNGFAYVDKSQVYFLQPEKLDSYEAGLKTRFFDDRLQLNGAVFHYVYSNQQVSEIVGAVGFLRSLNAKVTGAELELLAKPVPTVTLRGSVGYLHTKYDENQVLSGQDSGGNELP